MYLITIWPFLKNWDQTVLFHINQVWSNPVFDTALPFFRYPAFWGPVYLFFIAFVLINFGKKGAFWVLFLLLTIGIADQLSSHLIKPWVARLRPCNDPFMLQYITIRIENCGTGFSFTSSHAANHFAMAGFIYATLSKVLGRQYVRWVFLWAFTICYAQMYVGVHYPIDIIGGTLVGLFSGWVTSRFFNRKFMLRQPDIAPPEEPKLSSVNN